MSIRKNDFDVIVIGGGLAGMTMACMLGKANIKVACIDAADPAALLKADERTTAISYGSRKILDEAGIWQHLGPKICTIKDIEILDGGSSVLLEFLSQDSGQEAFGWIVDNRDLRAAQMQQMKALKSVSHIAPASVQDFEITDNAAKAVLADGTTLSAKLIIGADGKNSFTRKWMDVPVREWSYNQRAMICIAAHKNPHNNVAVEHFFPAGPFAILPMHDEQDGTHRSAVVFTEHGPQKQSLMNLSDKDFEIALAARFPERYGNIKLTGKRFSFPLSLVHAAEYIRPRMALIADAAHGIHPIAGQGLNLGFRDIKALSDLLTVAAKSGADLGDSELLERYQRQRRPDNMAMVAMTDTLNRLFSNNFLPLRLARKIGLRAVSKLTPAKKFFMRQAMGDF